MTYLGLQCQTVGGGFFARLAASAYAPGLSLAKHAVPVVSVRLHPPFNDSICQQAVGSPKATQSFMRVEYLLTGPAPLRIRICLYCSV